MPAKHGYILPEVIDPERICVQLNIPNEMNHLLAFWGQLAALGSALTWDNDPAHTALPVSAVWRDVYQQARTRYLSGQGCNGMSEECCDEITIRLEEQLKRFDRIISLMEGGFTIMPLNGVARPPDEAGGDCAPDYFDHNTDDTEPDAAAKRRKALCITTERYLKSILLNVLVDMNAFAAIFDWITAQFTQTVPVSLADLVIVYPSVFSGLNVFFDAITGNLDLVALQCAMVEGLSGDKNNTFVNFRDSLNAFVPDSLMGSFVDLVKGANGVKANYKAFNKALNDANNEDLSGYTCPCDPPPAEFTLIDNYWDAVFTDLGGGMWRMQQPNENPSVPGQYDICIRATDDRLLHWGTPTSGSAVAHWYTYAQGVLDGTPGVTPIADGVGGFGGDFYGLGLTATNPIDITARIESAT